MKKCRECGYRNYSQARKCKKCEKALHDPLAEAVKGKTLEQLATWYTPKRPSKPAS
jgi:uncharacterized membrane protein YvbJ